MISASVGSRTMTVASRINRPSLGGAAWLNPGAGTVATSAITIGSGSVPSRGNANNALLAESAAVCLDGFTPRRPNKPPNHIGLRIEDKPHEWEANG